MKPLSTTQQEQDKLFDELCIGCGFGAANIQGLKEFMRNRDLAIENAVRVELVEKIKALLPDSMTEAERDKYHCEGSILHWGENLLALLTTSPSR